MQLSTLEYITDAFFWRVEGAVVDRGAYVKVDTPTRRGWYYGNLLIFPGPPAPGDAALWPELFRQEFGHDPTVRHVLLAWESDPREESVAPELLAEGYERSFSVTLVAEHVLPPPHPNPSIVVREIRSDREWEQVERNMVANRDPRFAEQTYAGFIARSVRTWRALTERGHGAWHGAFLGERLVGDLGLFVIDGIGRFQSVSTASAFRRQGICGTLVSAVAERALGSGLERLVMVADEEYIAARVYESVGFRPVERNGALLLYPPEERGVGRSEVREEEAGGDSGGLPAP